MRSPTAGGCQKIQKAPNVLCRNRSQNPTVRFASDRCAPRTSLKGKRLNPPRTEVLPARGGAAGKRPIKQMLAKPFKAVATCAAIAGLLTTSATLTPRSYAAGIDGKADIGIQVIDWQPWSDSVFAQASSSRSTQSCRNCPRAGSNLDRYSADRIQSGRVGKSPFTYRRNAAV